ncbi:MAG: hypothetical protein M1495_06515 [Bacteroidetes bacterium]|nr:hypothetical protein [Bacteroidota bacterium]
MNLLDQLKRQIDFIRRSCEAYDNGYKDDALRLAVSIRVLFHDTPQSISLLNQLGVKNKIHLISTMSIEIPDIENKKEYNTIYIPIMLTSEGVKPPLEESDRRKLLTVDEWWDEPVMIQLNSFSRKDIVLSAANQDGGAHVDDNPSKKTKELKEGVGTLTITIDGNSKTEKLINHHFHLLRQLGYELLNSRELVSLV